MVIPATNHIAVMMIVAHKVARPPGIVEGLMIPTCAASFPRGITTAIISGMIPNGLKATLNNVLKNTIWSVLPFCFPTIPITIPIIGRMTIMGRLTSLTVGMFPEYINMDHHTKPAKNAAITPTGTCFVFKRFFISDSFPIIETDSLKNLAQFICELRSLLFSAVFPILSTVEYPSFSVSTLPVVFPSFKTNSILELT